MCLEANRQPICAYINWKRRSGDRRCGLPGFLFQVANPPADPGYAAKVFEKHLADSPEYAELRNLTWAIGNDGPSGLYFATFRPKVSTSLGASFKANSLSKKTSAIVFDRIDSQMSTRQIFNFRIPFVMGGWALGAAHGNMSDASEFLTDLMKRVNSTLVRWQLLVEANKSVGANFRQGAVLNFWALVPQDTEIPEAVDAHHQLHIDPAYLKFQCKYCHRVGHQRRSCPKIRAKCKLCASTAHRTADCKSSAAEKSAGKPEHGKPKAREAPSGAKPAEEPLPKQKDSTSTESTSGPLAEEGSHAAEKDQDGGQTPLDSHQASLPSRIEYAMEDEDINLNQSLL